MCHLKKLPAGESQLVARNYATVMALENNTAAEIQTKMEQAKKFNPGEADV